MDNSIKLQISTSATHWFALNRIYHTYAQEYGLTTNQLYALLLFSESPEPPTQRQILDYMAIPKSTLNSMLSGFLEKGWIELKVDSDDRRKKRVHFTEAGREFSEPLLRRMHEIECRAYSRMTREQLQALTSLSMLEAIYLRDTFEEALNIEPSSRIDITTLFPHIDEG